MAAWGGLGGLRRAEGEAIRGGRERAAVVAILNLEDPADPELLFVVRRISTTDMWSGQVAFPGGKWMEEDGDLLATAARELREETGLQLDEDVMLLGALDEVRPSNMPQLSVVPFLAAAEKRVDIKLGEELSAYFWARLESLEPAEKIQRSSNGSYRTFPAFRYSAWVIWGMTYRILQQILQILRKTPNCF